MIEQLLEHYEVFVYPGVYVGSLAVVGFWEVFYPRRELSASILSRWVSAAALAAIYSLIVRFAAPLLTIPFAIWLTQTNIGLFNTIDAPLWLAVFVSFWVLDFSAWLQHWLRHRVPILWLLHRTHHNDHDYDFSTGLRFHPGDALFTGSFQILTIALLGAPVEAVVLVGIVQIAFVFFTHGNVIVPLGIDRVVRSVIVTPDVHRIHHSAVEAEGDANFGGVVTWWDHLFGTYLDQPQGGHEGMVLGLNEFCDPKHMKIHWILANPFLLPDAEAADSSDRFAPAARVTGAGSK